MHLHKLGRDVVVHAPAKLNLFFEILDRRSDGFHEVETVVYPIDLYDTLILRGRRDARTELRLSHVPWHGSVAASGTGGVPSDASNLVVRAIELLRREGSCELGVDAHLIKRIPSEAGLGGGSSDAAAALAGVNRLLGLNWPTERLASLGAGLGSDVPLFFWSGASVCRGRGELVESAAASPMLHFAMVHPPAGLRTAEVYGACEVARRPRSAGRFIEAMASADFGRIGESLFNRLERPAAELSPWIARVRGAFDRVDCAGRQMTGSGTCYFGLCRHARHARRVARRLESLGIGKAYAVRGCR